MFLLPLKETAVGAARAGLPGEAHGLFDLVTARQPGDLTASAEAALSALLTALESPSGTTEFADALAQDEKDWQTALDTFGPLRDLATTRLRNWAEASAELVTRLLTDRDALTGWLGLDRPLDPVAVTTALGDTHRGARSVAAVTDRSGVRFAYRPRPVDIGAAFARFCAAIGETDVHTPDLLPGNGYGWARWVEHRPCGDRPAYATRLGRALAVLWALGGTDLHQENVVGDGARPVLVDLETPLGIDPVLIAGEPGAWAVHDSVLSTSMLPGARPFDGAPNVGALAEFLSSAPDRERDALGEDVLAGFLAAARNVTAHRDRLLGPDSPLAVFTGLPLRVLVRPTYRYAELLTKADHPALLCDRDARLDHFGQLALDGDRPRPELVAAEVADLLAGDVPLTEVEASDVEVRCAGAPVCVLDRSPLDRAREKIRNLTEEVVSAEAELVRACLLTDRFNRDGPCISASTSDSGEADLLDGALAAGLALRRSARSGPAGVSWLDISSVGGRDWHVGPSDDSLYRGLPGIALACAELAHRTGDTRIASLRDDVVESWLRTPVPTSLGAFAGAAGHLAAARLVARRAPDPGLAERAGRALSVLSGASDDSLAPDVHFGVAGAVLVLRAVGSDSAAWQACGTRLLTAVANEPPRLTGFAHGTSGMVLALKILADQGFPAAFGYAEQLSAWQEGQFVPGEGWRDLRFAADGPVRTTWCNGTAGIGTALALETHLGLGGDRERLRTAVTTSAAEGTGSVLNPCDGDLGVAALLLDAGVLTGEDEWALRGRRLARGVAARVLADRVPNPLDRRSGLMTGYAGVVLGLLHAADPADVPSATSVALNLLPSGRAARIDPRAASKLRR
ncbi:DUF4135 domain-containing protein [Amycolatopsis sp. CA-230715]|uniref:DUF4135 domain-containing protein n=1 Tax=Amycolatopsis sp. CA-230715 TaxID=2745196 RepID=UPI001C02254C|nr:DUF4135 domain-containing protein [Amycolatopsis sp. CA-230715]